MKILFLDIDGVLSTQENKLNDYSIKNLNRIKTESGCKVVLTSSWRKSNERLLMLKNNGIEYYSCTPDFSTQNDRHGAVHRTKEIKSWLKNNQCETFVIIDDDAESLVELKDYLFQTNYKIGLTIAIADKIIDRFNLLVNKSH